MQPLSFVDRLSANTSASLAANAREPGRRAWRFAPTVPTRSAVALLVSAGTLLLLSTLYDLRAAAASLARIPPAELALAVLAIAAGLAVSCLRYRAVLAALGLPIPLALAARANLVGILGGVMFFQIVGQTLARTAVLARRGIGGSAVLVANVYERLTALASLTVLALLGAAYLYGGLSFEMMGGGSALVKLVVALFVAILAAAMSTPRLTRFTLRALARGRPLAGAGQVALATLAMHLTTLVAFVVLGHGLAPQIPVADLAAASLIVMLVASAPVSFAGWGIRELSAIYAYGKIGMDAETALAVSILVGLTSLALAILFGAACWRDEPAAAADAVPATAARNLSSNLARTLGWLLPLLATTLIFFQVHVPVAAGALNVNLADPIAIAGAFVFATRLHSRAAAARLWRIEHLELALAAITLTLAFAYLNGRITYGPSDWALWNRLVGWLVLLAYVATGALVVATAGQLGRRTLIGVMVAAAAAVAGLDLALHLSGAAGIIGMLLQPGAGLSGMAQNPNAYALQIAVVLAFVCARPSDCGTRRTSAPILALMVLALYYARSRTGYIAGFAVLSGALAMGWMPKRTATIALSFAAAVIAAPFAAQMLAEAFGGPAASVPQSFAVRIVHASSDSERWYSIQRGMELWTAHPIFGAGLGAFMSTTIAETGRPLVIHNTSVWLLAELGVVGLTLVSGLFAAIWRRGWIAARSGDDMARGLVLALLACGLFQMTHDIFSQRIVWLVLGATMFKGLVRRPSTAAQPSIRSATSSAMAREAVSPGLSMP